MGLELDDGPVRGLCRAHAGAPRCARSPVAGAARGAVVPPRPVGRKCPAPGGDYGPGAAEPDDQGTGGQTAPMARRGGHTAWTGAPRVGGSLVWAGQPVGTGLQCTWWIVFLACLWRLMQTPENCQQDFLDRYRR